MQKTIKPYITKCEKSCNLNNFNISVDILPQITAKFPQKHSLNINRADSHRRGQYQLRLSVGCVVVETDVEIVVVINCPYVVASHAV